MVQQDDQNTVIPNDTNGTPQIRGHMFVWHLPRADVRRIRGGIFTIIFGHEVLYICFRLNKATNKIAHDAWCFCEERGGRTRVTRSG